LADTRFALGFFYQSAANHLLSSVSVNVPFGTQKMLWFLAALWVRPKEICWHGGCVIPRADSKGRKVKIMRLKTILWALSLTCSLAGSMACNTVHGMGQDIERGGEKTQDAADAVKRRM
jgi:predicted small secreted protein